MTFSIDHMQNFFSEITIYDVVLALQNPLPGEEAHLRMLPKGRSLLYSGNDPNIKNSAVLLLIYPENGELYFCLTKRNSGLKHHPGQISFPGGRCEPHETDPYSTALRETEEEIGVPQNSIQQIGRLSEVFVPVSNFNIHPYVGYISEKPQFKVCHKEVDELIIFPLNTIFPIENHTERLLETRNGLMNVPCYLIEKQIIWGATSMMIAELEAILRQYYSHREPRLDNADSGREH